MRGKKVEKKGGRKDGKEVERKATVNLKKKKTVHCVHSVYFVIMFCTIRTATVIVSP